MDGAEVSGERWPGGYLSHELSGIINVDGQRAARGRNKNKWSMCRLVFNLRAPAGCVSEANLIPASDSHINRVAHKKVLLLAPAEGQLRKYNSSLKAGCSGQEIVFLSRQKLKQGKDLAWLCPKVTELTNSPTTTDPSLWAAQCLSLLHPPQPSSFVWFTAPADTPYFHCSDQTLNVFTSLTVT